MFGSLPMPGEDRSATPIALMEAALARAADEVGDLTQPVMDRLRRRCPDTEATFVRLGLGRPDQLAGQMVETALYCLMSWLDEEAPIRIMLHESLPHHCLTLGIEPELFRALAEETADLVIETIPATAPTNAPCGTRSAPGWSASSPRPPPRPCSPACASPCPPLPDAPRPGGGSTRAPCGFAFAGPWRYGPRFPGILGSGP